MFLILNYHYMSNAERKEIIRGLSSVVNKHGLENYSNTPDFVLGEYLFNCLMNHSKATIARNDWYKGGNGSYPISALEPNSNDDY